MNVINLSLGEPEIEPTRDIVVTAIDGAARAGVVPVIAAGNDFSDFGYGSISSPGNAPSAITVAAVTTTDVIASFSSAGPTPVSLKLKPDVTAPGVAILSSLPTPGRAVGPARGDEHGEPARRGRRRAAQAAASRLDGRADQVGARPDRRPGPRRPRAARCRCSAKAAASSTCRAR